MVKTTVMRKLLIFCLSMFLLAFATSAFAQVKVTTPFKDMKVRVLRCAVIGDNCVVDMLFENVGAQDLKIWSNVDFNRAYDDAGNEYNTNYENTIFFYAGDMKNNIPGFNKELNFMSEIPVKVRAELKNISEIATEIRRLDLAFWMPDRLDRPTVKISNIPISR